MTLLVFSSTEWISITLKVWGGRERKHQDYILIIINIDIIIKNNNG